MNTPTPLRCTGCGTAMTDTDLKAVKARNPRILSCCPERDMKPKRRKAALPSAQGQPHD